MSHRNLPNALTILRILLIPVVVIALLAETTPGDVTAAAVFAFAAITDGVDGYLARSRGNITTLGKLLDPIADKMLIVGTMVTLVSLERLNIWVALAVIGREFAVTGLRMVLSEHGQVISASWLGKWKTGFQIAAILVVIMFDQSWWVDLLVYSMLIVTVVSGIDYFMNVNDRIDTDPDEEPAFPNAPTPG